MERGRCTERPYIFCAISGTLPVDPYKGREEVLGTFPFIETITYDATLE